MTRLPKRIRKLPVFGRMTLTKFQEAELDKLWSLAVKKRAGMRCEMDLLHHDRLEAHHVIGRRNKTLRHVVSNGVSLCHMHHRFAEENGLSFRDWVIKSRGELWWEELQKLGLIIKHWKQFTIVKEYLKTFIED